MGAFDLPTLYSLVGCHDNSKLPLIPDVYLHESDVSWLVVDGRIYNLCSKSHIPTVCCFTKGCVHTKTEIETDTRPRLIKWIRSGFYKIVWHRDSNVIGYHWVPRRIRSGFYKIVWHRDSNVIGYQWHCCLGAILFCKSHFLSVSVLVSVSVSLNTA